MIQQYICIFSLFWRIKLLACLLPQSDAFTWWRCPSLCLFVCLFVRRQCVLIGHWFDWPSNAILLAAVSGRNAAAGPVRPVADILMAAGAYRVGHSLHSDSFNPLGFWGTYGATSNNMKLVHWPLMGGLLHLVQRGGDWGWPQPTQGPPSCTKCNSHQRPVYQWPYWCLVVRCSVVIKGL